MSTPVSATIRMYRLRELGDCFLLAFATDKERSHVLIDCGSFRNSAKSIARMRQVTEDIRDTLGAAKLDVIVGTHQHNDHVSGFVHCEDTFRDEMQIDQVWLSWLDDPQNKQAQRIGADFNNIVKSLQATHAKLRQSTGSRKALEPVRRLGEILGFHAARTDKEPPEVPRRGIEILKSLGAKKPAYLSPGRILDLPGLPADCVRVHVLGPPKNEDDLFDKDPAADQSYDHKLRLVGAAATRLRSAVEAQGDSEPSEELFFPFSEKYKIRESSRPVGDLRTVMRAYRARKAAWRTIDDDWLQQTESLALFMDTFTNNSSLVLAFELVKSGKVLLFAADAQTGNWVSWANVKWKRDDVTTDDLLKRTVFYKVGHHGSHNATLVEAFEKMDNLDLVALIPVDKQDPNIKKEKGGWKMPASNLFKRLKQQTSNRVLQMDNDNPPSCNLKKDPARRSWKKVGITPKVTPMYVELTIE